MFQLQPHPLLSRLPSALQELGELAVNLWWSWDPEGKALWPAIDATLWEAHGHDPVALLSHLTEEQLAALAADETFLQRTRGIHQRFQAYLSYTPLQDPAHPVVYLSMEFGLHESMRIYSGGLGVLAGDHIRSASDIGVPMVGIGLMYYQGYFRQVFDRGRQLVAYLQFRPEESPLIPVVDSEGAPVEVEVPYGRGSFRARAWGLQVGRTTLILLDSDLPGNSAFCRSLSQQLYGGDQTTRIAQEVLLGIGGVRMMRALGIEPSCVHLNEGHCAFAPLEILREQLRADRSLAEALEFTRELTVFTTHTPVPAGHDRFSWDVLNQALIGYREAEGWREGAIMDLGRVRKGDLDETLCMTVLALKLARAANGVSKLHGEVSREMWKDLYPMAISVDEVPIGSITNGVHPLFWMADDTRAVFDRAIPAWDEHLEDAAWWEEAVERLSDQELWGLRSRLRQTLLQAVAKKHGLQLDPEALTIGFARRFAPYKRANLIFSDRERLLSILQGDRPVQLLFAGKAHPRDGAGQDLVAEVLRMAHRADLRDRVLLIEDYDMVWGRLLTQGVDLWLNNPRRPREASGTSGQKVCLNGGLNFSVLDGWWPEGYNEQNGWSIGEEREYESLAQQDEADADSLYTTLEEQILPAFYERDAAGLPQAWLSAMRSCIASCLPLFNTNRRVRDYFTQLYRPEN